MMRVPKLVSWLTSRWRERRYKGRVTSTPIILANCTLCGRLDYPHKFPGETQDTQHSAELSHVNGTSHRIKTTTKWLTLSRKINSTKKGLRGRPCKLWGTSLVVVTVVVSMC